MEKKNIENIYNSKIKELIKHNEQYYDKSNPTISDAK